MRWLTALLVFVATPLVLLAAVAFLPVGWLTIGGVVFVLGGAVAALRVRDQHRRAPLGQTDEAGHRRDDTAAPP